ncbi:chemotaxis regulatory protein ChePep-like [Osmia bicornis bicornis]|uniref:chemotaxis regulatory protein ChePep-like n=1 Tax=Osmia bicornis bicornis TaxID=1437191 RepID=UPI0010F72984|nr:chemotaxis regulatory protein ChePep-like [Osmia bicornis bicornis]
MGKTPKKAAPGGDERNLNNWRVKATTDSSETSLPKRQRESEISNRSKLSTVQKKIPPGQRKYFKSVASKSEENQSTKQKSKLPGPSKEKKLTVPGKSVELKVPKTMQPESEETEAKLNPTVETENEKKEDSVDNQESAKECVDQVPSKEQEPVSKEKEEDSTDKETIVEKEQTVCVNANNVDKSKEVEDADESDLKLSLEVEDTLKVQEEKPNDKDVKDEHTEECSLPSKNDAIDKEDLQSESQTDTESYSVLESTTSEVSEVSEIASQNDAQKEKTEKIVKDATKDTTKDLTKDHAKDTSFVSYDPSIMLKDVQIKLNDCLKENSKLFDTSTIEHSSPSQPSKESFGKTLRSISGRRSLNRMRFVTMREHRYSPNDSLFVNTSTASMPADDTSDFKILRYNTGLSDVLSTTNGSPTERKRKHDTEDWNTMKKQRTESEQSLLHTSIDLLKGLRRPIQVSTPVSELKFQSGKLNLGNEQESKQPNEATKKWCAIM